MSSMFSASNPSTRSHVWSRIFAGMIEDRRQALGRSQEEAARMAGMESSEWAAVVCGELPVNRARLGSMAAALEVRADELALLVFLCRDAWAA